MLKLDPATTALVLIDLQKGIVTRSMSRSGDAVVSAAMALACRFRAAGSQVVLVNVAFSHDGGDLPPEAVDQPMQLPSGGMPAGFSDLVEGLAQPIDMRITKRHWSAFHGTELDLQLRRRGVGTSGSRARAAASSQLGIDTLTVTRATSASRDKTSMSRSMSLDFVMIPMR